MTAKEFLESKQIKDILYFNDTWTEGIFLSKLIEEYTRIYAHQIITEALSNTKSGSELLDEWIKRNPLNLDKS